MKLMKNKIFQWFGKQSFPKLLNVNEKGLKMKFSKKTIPYLIVFLISIAIAIAIQPNPEVYQGYVFLEENPANDGDILTVETQNQELLASQILPVDPDKKASYAINILFDDPLTPEDEGVLEGEKLIWKLNGVEVLEPINDIAEPGKTNNNFEIQSYANPNLSIDVSYAENEIAINQELEITILMENNGDGTAIANMHIVSQNLNSNIPANITINRHNSSSIKIPLVPTGCGEYNVDIVTSYYNIANRLVDSTTNPISFTSKAHDIELTSIEISDLNPRENDSISISAIVSNIGDYDIDEFKILFYDQIIDGALIQRITSNNTLKKGQNITVQFNWQPPTGTFNIHAILDIDKPECSLNNNVQNSEAITVVPVQQEENDSIQSTTIIYGAEQECIEHNVKLNEQGTIIAMQPNCDLAIFEYKNKKYNLILMEKQDDSVKLSITSPNYSYETILKQTEIKEIDLALDNSYGVYLSLIELGENPKIKIGLTNQEPPLTGFITKKSEKGFSIITLIMLILVIAIIAFYIKKGAIKLPKFKKKEKTEQIKQPDPKPEVQQQLIKSTPKPESKTEIKPEKHKPEFIPLTNIPSKLKTTIADTKPSKLLNVNEKGLKAASSKKIPKIDPGLSDEEKKLPQVPYEYLSEAIELMEKFRKNLQPRDELIKKYSNEYPKFLIDMVARNIFTHSNFRENIDVIDELERLRILDKEYNYISISKLRQAIEILAKAYASKDNKENKFKGEY